ncbi:YhfG family protein [Photobacterium jeanii]|uniref:YhfG family protein n=1 Tax=Photobacterium jeanii TaxID=858640 RepID=UPI000AB50AEC|nr:YhfG family protein [Photobacterium jeanii]
MLDEQQKRMRFKAMQRRNYQASLQLEGFELDCQPEVKSLSSSNTEAEEIRRLRQAYAR